MELIKKTDNYTIYKKKSGRYAVKNKEKKYLSDKEKVEIFIDWDEENFNSSMLL